MRIAMKLGYVGTDYHGFQLQPDVDTIEGELFASLYKLDLIKSPHEANYAASGRTDKGVHAAGQVIAFNTERPELAIPKAINSNLDPAIWTWARARVHDDFNPRRDAISRQYMYIIPGKFDIHLLEKASGLMIGEHDFSNFITPENGRSPVAKINYIKVRMVDGFTIIDISAGHFLWHMVRKIAAALGLIGGGKKDLEWLSNMLSPRKFHEALEPAPAYGLIMKNVEYDDISWKEDPYAKKKALKAFEGELLWHSVMAKMFCELKENMSSGLE